MLILDILKVIICGTREFNYNVQKSVFHNRTWWGSLASQQPNPWLGFSKESIDSLVLVTSQHHIESDKVKPPFFDPVSHRDQT